MQLLKKGTQIKQITPAIEGVVLSSQVHDDVLQYLIEYIGADGETHQRWFHTTEVEAI